MAFSLTSVTRKEREREPKKGIKSKEGMTYLRLELFTQFERKKQEEKKKGRLMMQERLGPFDQNTPGGDS